jgi:hypothetical protein
MQTPSKDRAKGKGKKQTLGKIIACGGGECNTCCNENMAKEIFVKVSLF